MNAIWEEAGQLAILQTWSKSWSRVYDEETPARVGKELELGRSSFHVQNRNRATPPSWL